MNAFKPNSTNVIIRNVQSPSAVYIQPLGNATVLAHDQLIIILPTAALSSTAYVVGRTTFQDGCWTLQPAQSSCVWTIKTRTQLSQPFRATSVVPKIGSIRLTHNDSGISLGVSLNPNQAFCAYPSAEDSGSSSWEAAY